MDKSPSSKSPTKHLNTNELLIVELHRLRKEIRQVNSFKTRFIGGLVTGLGTVLGATLLVALLIFILSQLANIEMLRPFIEEITRIVESSKT